MYKSRYHSFEGHKYEKISSLRSTKKIFTEFFWWRFVWHQRFQSALPLCRVLSLSLMPHRIEIKRKFLQNLLMLIYADLIRPQNAFFLLSRLVSTLQSVTTKNSSDKRRFFSTLNPLHMLNIFTTLSCEASNRKIIFIRNLQENKKISCRVEKLIEISVLSIIAVHWCRILPKKVIENSHLNDLRKNFFQIWSVIAVVETLKTLGIRNQMDRNFTTANKQSAAIVNGLFFSVAFLLSLEERMETLLSQSRNWVC